MKFEDLLRIVRAALEGATVPYMLTGSLASSAHGIPRATHDIDIVVEPTRQQLIALVERFKRIGLYVSSEAALAALDSRTDFNVIDFAGGWKVDFIIRKTRPFSLQEFARRSVVEVEGEAISIATPEDVLIAKLEWAQMGGSERQIDDAAGILSMQRDTLDFAYVEHWVESLGLQESWHVVRQRAG